MRLAHALLAAWAWCVPAGAQEIAETRWGFDGRVVAGEFNVLSVLVVNATARPFDDTLVLQRSVGLTKVGAPMIERCYLAPASRRLLQLPVFITDDGSGFDLTWAKAPLASFAVPGAKQGHRAAVLLEAEPELGAAIEGLRSFPAAWFPASVAACGALSDVVLDHVPEWDAARREAFLGWLRSGGRLHLLRSAGEWPQFTGELGVLNEGAESSPFGVGRMLRYSKGRAATTADSLDLATATTVPDDPTVAQPRSPAPQVLLALQGLVRPEHSWGLIFVAALAFLVLVGPVHWRLAKRLDYRASIAVLLAVVGAFTWLFLQLGARGYGERAGISTLTYAYRLDDGHWLATQYTTAFVTSGGTFAIGANSESALLATPVQTEAVPETLASGRGARFTVDIPLFSSRTLLQRATIAAPTFTVRIASWPDRRELGGLVLETTGAFDAAGCVWAAACGSGGWTARLEHRGQGFMVLEGKKPIEESISLKSIREGDVHEVPIQPWQRTVTAGPAEIETLANQMLSPLLAERLHLLHEDDTRAFKARETLSALFLCRAPAEFHLQAPGLGAEQGYVLYHVEITP